jgi:hydroxypyruvate isomerase
MMPKFAANLTMLFNEVPMLDRAALAQQAGFDGAEILFPYDHDLPAWRKALGDFPLVLINTPPGDWAAGDRGFAAVVGARPQFQDSFERGLDYACALGAQRLHVMAGAAKGPAAEAQYMENLAWAAAKAPDVTLLIEPLNVDDMPGYFLNDFDHAARMIDNLGASNVKLQFDLWHAAKIHGNALAVWQRHLALIGHVQIAGFPARNEPGGGGFDLTQLCDAIDGGAAGGWIAAEYRPARATVHGLGWLGALKTRGLLMGAQQCG